jgi:hypothetical protein
MKPEASLCVRKNPPLYSILGQINPIHILTPYF